MFKYLCSYHQVSPDILKLVHSLGEQIRHSKNFCCVGFFDDILTRAPSGSLRDLAGLGRSGREFRNCYQIQAMECSPQSDGKWVRRQLTAYNALDIETGRCFWITIKADKDIRERIFERQQSLDKLRPDVVKDVGSAFIASLYTHQIHLDWCVEGWRWSIDDREARLRKILKRAQAVPIRPDNPVEFVRSFPIRQPTLERSIAPPDSRGCVQRLVSCFSSSPKSKSNGNVNTLANPSVVDEADAAIEQCNAQTRKVLRDQHILEKFSITEFQDLTSNIVSLEEAKLAMTLNIDILESIRDSYESFFSSEQCPHEIRDKCRSDLFLFLRRIKALERELNIERQRADALKSQLQEAKPLVRK